MIAFRWMALFDSHGDQLDPGAAGVAFEFARHFKPELRIAGGDHFDMRWLRANVSEEERRGNISEDIDAGAEFLRQWDPDVRLWGNHGWRLVQAIMDAKMDGERHYLLTSLLDQIEASLPSHEVVPYCKRNGVYRLGDHAVVHGYSSGVGMTRKHALTYGNVILGHGHAVEITSTERHDGATGYQAGCLCKLDMGYNRAHLGTLRQRHGFAYGTVSKSGRTTVWLAREEDDGTWVLPSEFTSLSSTPTLSPPSSGSDGATTPDHKEPSRAPSS